MNKMIRLSKSGIEYLDYVWNFYSGCENQKRGICLVPNCWAEGIVNRFQNHYPNGFKPTFYPEAFLSPLHLKKPSVIGVAFMGDLGGDWVDPDRKFHSTMPSEKASITMSLKGWIFTTIEQCPQHKFLFLTKCPWNLIKWSPFPDNCWVGVTATNQETFYEAAKCLADIKASVKYISAEPMLGRIIFPAWIGGVLNWIIVGSQTKPYKPPKIEDVEEVVRACDKAGIPIFLKDNLKPLLEKQDITSTNFGRLTSLKVKSITDAQGLPRQRGWYGLRQEMPGKK